MKRLVWVIVGFGLGMSIVSIWAQQAPVAAKYQPKYQIKPPALQLAPTKAKALSNQASAPAVTNIVQESPEFDSDDRNAPSGFNKSDTQNNGNVPSVGEGS